MIDFIINLSYYGTILSTLVVSSFVMLEFFSDTGNFTSNIKTYTHDTSYWIINKALEYKVAYDEKLHPFVKKFINSQRSDVIEINNTTYNKFIIGYDYYYSTKDDIDVIKLNSEKPFLNLTVKYIDETFDITEDIKPFIVVGNVINDDFIEDFLKIFNIINRNFDKKLLSYSYISSTLELITCDSVNFEITEEECKTDNISVENEDHE